MLCEGERERERESGDVLIWVLHNTEKPKSALAETLVLLARTRHLIFLAVICMTGDSIPARLL